MSFNYLTTDNGLSQFTVYALYNDEWGQIWIGTRDGLNVYNGNRIKTYKEEKGIRPLYWDVLSEESAATERG